MAPPRINQSELITFRGTTNGADVAETFSLYSTLMYGTDEYIRIPKGMKLKIHSIRVMGSDTDTLVSVKYTHDITAAIPTYVDIDYELQDNAVDIRISEEKKKPIILPGLTGDEAVAFDWLQTDASTAYLIVEVELTPA